MTYRVFIRNWWSPNPAWPDGREPSPGRKHTIAKVSTEAEAQARCEAYNTTHKPGFLSRKAEYESA